MYKLVRKVLFLWQPETIHNITLSILNFLERIPLVSSIIRLFYNYKNPILEREIFGVKFKNPVGLAAGFDKNGDSYNAISNFGFGFIEIGSLTPQKQDGNPKPRCFRLTKDQAIINRMGINNNGVKYAVSYLQKHKSRVPIGCSITKGSQTSVENSAADYEFAFEYMYDFVDYFVLNLSCPNVKDACQLQDAVNLSNIIDKLLGLRLMYDEYRPILVKISPDISYAQLDDIIDMVLISGLDGIIAANTTTDRSSLNTPEKQISKIGKGGLSGKPLFDKSLRLVRYIHQKSKGHLPIIASGGIMTPEQAMQMLDEGASLIEIYSGFIYNGPAYVKKINKYIAKRLAEKKGKK